MAEHSPEKQILHKPETDSPLIWYQLSVWVGAGVGWKTGR